MRRSTALKPNQLSPAHPPPPYVPPLETMRMKLYGRARPPGESYIFAAMLVKCGRSCQSAHRPVACARSNTRQRRVSVSLPTGLRVISTEVDISPFRPPSSHAAYVYTRLFRVHGRKKDGWNRMRIEYSSFATFALLFFGLKERGEGGREDGDGYVPFCGKRGNFSSFFLLLSIKNLVKGECREIFHARVFVHPLRQRRSFLLLRTIKLLSSHLVLIQFRDYSLRVE